MNRQTITFTVQVSVDADMAAKLPGYQGSNYGNDDLPVAGIDIEAQVICSELARKVLELLPDRLSPLIWERDYRVSPAEKKEVTVFAANVDYESWCRANGLDVMDDENYNSYCEWTANI